MTRTDLRPLAGQGLAAQAEHDAAVHAGRTSTSWRIRYYWFTATIILTILGAALFIYRLDKGGLNIDFVGGTAYTRPARRADDASTTCASCGERLAGQPLPDLSDRADLRQRRPGLQPGRQERAASPSAPPRRTPTKVQRRSSTTSSGDKLKQIIDADKTRRSRRRRQGTEATLDVRQLRRRRASRTSPRRPRSAMLLDAASSRTSATRPVRRRSADDPDGQEQGGPLLRDGRRADRPDPGRAKLERVLDEGRRRSSTARRSRSGWRTSTASWPPTRSSGRCTPSWRAGRRSCSTCGSASAAGRSARRPCSA